MSMQTAQGTVVDALQKQYRLLSRRKHLFSPYGMYLFALLICTTDLFPSHGRSQMTLAGLQPLPSLPLAILPSKASVLVPATITRF